MATRKSLLAEIERQEQEAAAMPTPTFKKSQATGTASKNTGTGSTTGATPESLLSEISRREQQSSRRAGLLAAIEKQEQQAAAMPTPTFGTTQTSVYKPQAVLDDHIGREALTGETLQTPEEKAQEVSGGMMDSFIKAKNPLSGLINVLETPLHLMAAQASEDMARARAAEEAADRARAEGKGWTDKAYWDEIFSKALVGPVDRTLDLLGYTDRAPEDSAARLMEMQEQQAGQKFKEQFSGAAAKSGIPESVSGVAADVLLTTEDMLMDMAMSGSAYLPYLSLRSGTGAAQKALDEGYSAGQALALGVASGAVSAATESFGGIAGKWGGKAMDKLMGTSLGRKIMGSVPEKAAQWIANAAESRLGRVAESVLSEGAEEFTEYYAQNFFENLILDKDTPYDVQEALYNALIGGLSGGMHTGAVVGTDAILDSAYKASERNAVGASIQQQDGGASLLRAARESDIPELMELAEQYAGQLQKGKALSRGQLYELQQAERALGVEAKAAEAPGVRFYDSPEGKGIDPDRVKGAAQQETQNSEAVRQAARPAAVRSEASQTAETQGRTDGFAASLGEHGQAAWAEAVRDAESRGASSELLGGAWKQYYNAGKYGKTMEWADRMDTAARQLITGDNIAKQAFQAGQLDAQAAAMEDRAGKAQAASLRKARESGLFFDSEELKAQVDEDTRAALDSLGRAFGYRFEVGEMEVGNGSFDPSTGVIRLNAKAAGRTALVNVAKHEITHQMQTESPELYRQYKDFVAAALMERDGQTFEALVQQQIDLYAGQAGVSLSREMAEDEVVANATELFLTDEESIRRLCEDNRTLGQKFLDLIRQVIRKVQEALSGAEMRQEATKLLAEDLDTLQQAETLWTRMLGGEKERVDSGEEKGYAGEKGARYALEGEDEDAQRVRHVGRGEKTAEETGAASGAGSQRKAEELRGNVRTSLLANRRRFPQLGRSGFQTEEKRGEFLTRHYDDRNRIAKRLQMMDMGLECCAVYKWPEDGQANSNAIAAAAVLSEYHIRNDVFEELYTNVHGRTYDHRGIEGITLRNKYKALMLLNWQMSEDGTVTAYHEMYHFMKRTDADLRDAFREVLFSNIEYNDAFREFVTYWGAVYTSQWDMENDMNSVLSLFEEELPAFYCGEAILRDPNRKGWKLISEFVNDIDTVNIEMFQMLSAFKERQAERARPKKRFSLEAPVEETEKLLALHNLSEEKLLKLVELGGIPMPSVAVVRASQGHDGFGDISLVLGKESIDPQADSRSRVYGADGWTPTFPHTEWKVQKKARDAFESRIGELSGKLAGGALQSSRVLAEAGVTDASVYSVREIAEKLAASPAVRAAYLADQGETVKAVKGSRMRQYDGYGNEALQTLIDRGEAQLKAMYQRTMAVSGLTDGDRAAVREAVRGALQKKGGILYTESKIEKKLARLTDDRMESFIENAWDLYRDGGLQQGGVDLAGTRALVNEKIGGGEREIRKKVADWVRPQLSGLLGEMGIRNEEDAYTETGRKSFEETHIPATLEAIVESMASQKERGESGLRLSAQALAGAAAARYETVDQMRADSGRLSRLSAEDYEARVRPVEQQLQAVLNTLCGGDPDAETEVGSLLAEAAGLYSRGGASAQAVSELFERGGYPLEHQEAEKVLRLIKAAAELPTEYFEAKPRRAVGFDEVLAAVIPDSSGEELRAALEKIGVDTLEYKAADEGDRLRKVNSVRGARFQLEAVPEITREMTEDERYQALKDVRFPLAEYVPQSLSEEQAKELETAIKSRARTIIRPLAEKFGIFKSYRSEAIELEFEYTKRSFDESIHKQSLRTGRFGDFAKMFTVFDKLVQSAVPIEVHGDKYVGTIREDPRLEQTYVLVSAFRDGSALVPVQFEIKMLRDQPNKLYVSVTLKKIETGVEGAAGSTRKSDLTAPIPVSDYSIAQLFSEIKPDEVDFLKYIPDGFLSEEQKAGKAEGLRREAEKVDALRQGVRQDVRYQLESGDESPVVRKLERENSRLKAAVESLRQQFSLTRGVQVKASDVEKLAGKVIREYSSKADAGALSEKLKAVYDYLGNDPDPNWETVWGVVSEAARSVLEQSETVDRTLWNETKELRQRLRETKLYVSEEERGDFEADGGFAAFKRQNRGLRLTGERGDLSVDQLYTELCQQYPGWFDGESVSAYDQLCEITDFLEAVRPKPTNPFGQSLDEQADQLAGELFDAYFDIPQVKTYADKKQAQIDALRRKSRAEMAALRQEQQERYERKLQETREQLKARESQLKRQLKEQQVQQDWEIAFERMEAEYQQARLKGRLQQRIGKERARSAALKQDVEEGRQKLARTRKEARYDRIWAIALEKRLAKDRREQLRDRQQIAATRKKIERKVKSLSQALLKPSDKQSIPEGMRKAVQTLITSLDMTGRQGEDTKVSAAWAQLQQQVAAAVEDESRAFPLDPELQERVNTLAAERVRLNTMTLEQAGELYKALSALEKAARGVRAELRDGRKLESSEVAYSMIENLSRMKARPERESRVKAGLRNFFDYDLTDPVRFFKRFGAEGIYESLRDGQNQMISRWNEALRFTDGLLENDKAWKWQEETNTFQLESGEQLRLTVSQAMELYLLTRRPQALGHLLGGGITLKDREQGGRIYRGGNYQLTVTDLEAITKSLTVEQKRVADRMGEYLSGTVSEWGNGVTMELYGYRKFTEKHYWPISSDQNYNTSQFDGTQRDVSLANLGMTKQVVDGAQGPLVLGDAFTTFSRHVSQMAAYSAFLPRMERISAVFNWKTSHNGNYRSTKQALEQVGGKGAVQYWDSLLRDINGGGRIERSPGERRMGRIKAGSIAGNLRVVVQQPTAYLRASALISPKYLAKGLVSKGGFEEMKIYAPIARWKDWGYFEAGNGKQLEELVLGRHGALNRVQDASMAPAGAMDNLTWGRIWAAVKLEIEDTTNLEPRSEEFLQAAGRRFSQIIDETQVVDSVLHRTQIMRSKNALVKMSTAFMGEPLKSLNLCMEAVDRIRQAKGLQEKLREAPHLLRVTAAFVSTAVVNALVVSLVDAGRDDDDGETWAQKYAQALLGDYEADMGAMERIRAALGANLTDNLNPLGMIPYLKDALSLFEGYDIKRMDMQGLTDVANSLLKWVPYASGGSRYRASYLIRDTASSLSKAFGLPMANIIREMNSLMNLSLTVLDDFGQDTTAFRYWLSKQTLDMAHSSNKGLFVSYLLEARMGGSTELATRIYNDLLEAGWTGKQLEDAMTARAKKLLEGYAPQLEAYNAALASGDAAGVDEAAGELLAEGFTAAEIQKAAKVLRGENVEDLLENYEPQLKAYNAARADGDEAGMDAAAGELLAEGFTAAEIQKAAKKLRGENEEEKEKEWQEIEEAYWEEYGESEADFDVSFAAEALVNGDDASYKRAEQALLDAGKTQKQIDSNMVSELKKRMAGRMGYDKLGDIPDGVFFKTSEKEYKLLHDKYGWTQYSYADAAAALVDGKQTTYNAMKKDMLGHSTQLGGEVIDEKKFDEEVKTALKKRMAGRMGYEKIGDIPEGTYLDTSCKEYRILRSRYGYTQFGYTDCVKAMLGKTKVSYEKMVADMVGQTSRSGKKFTEEGIKKEVKEQLQTAYNKGKYEGTASSAELAEIKRALLRMGISGALVEEKYRKYVKRKG